VSGLKISERNWLGPACVETSAGRSAGGIPPTHPFRRTLALKVAAIQASEAGTPQVSKF